MRTDAKENLITSIEIASAYNGDEPIVSEVCLYFEYKLYRANRTTKLSASQFEAFTSMNYPPLAESGVLLNFNERLLLRSEHNDLVVRKDLVTDIVVLKLFPGIPKPMVESVLRIPNLKGVILETFGAGNAPTKDWFIALLSEAIEKGIHIVNVTQCAAGSVLMGHYETSRLLQEIGVIGGNDITTESAIAKMMYLLGIGLSKEEFVEYYQQSLRGEITI